MKKIIILVFFTCLWVSKVVGQTYTSSIITGINEIAGAGTSVTLFASAASSTSSAALPIGFSFNFYGNPYTDFYINPNGTISFGSANQNYLSAYYTPQNTIPSTNVPNNFIGFAFINPYDNYPSPNLYPNYSGANVNYFVSGTAPNRILVVNFKNVVIPGSFPIPTRTLNVQTQLYESDGKIEVHNTTNSSPYSSDYNRYDHLQIGIENIDGTEATAATCAKNWSLNNKTVRFVYCASPGIPTNVTNAAICNAGGQQSVSLTATCSSGTPVWYANITSNDCIGLISNQTPISNTTVTPTATTLYRVRCENGTCKSPFVINTITVGNTNPAAPTSITKNPITPVTPNTAVILTANGCVSGTTIKWEDNSTTNPRTVNPALTSIYTAKCVNFPCESTTSASVTVNVNAPPVITATQNSICQNVGVLSNGSNIVSTTLTANGCSGNVTWSSFPSNAPKPTSNSGVIYSSDLTSNVTYTAYCAASGLTSASFLLTYIPKENGTITANPTQITTVGQSVALSTSNTIGTFTWLASKQLSLGYGSAVQIGTGVSLNHTPITTTEYSVSTTVSGCVFLSSVVKIPFQLTVSGTGNTNLDNTFNEGCARYLVADGGSGTPTLLCPNQTVDVGTHYFNQGLTTFSCGYYGTCARAYFIMRKNNVWEIWNTQSGYPNTNVSQRLYHTKIQYSTTYPPCTAIWINDADNSEVTLTNSGVCLDASACPINLAINASPALVLDVQSTLTASGCVSPNTLLWSTGSTSSIISVTPTNEVTYSVTCLSSNCTISSSISLAGSLTINGIVSPNGTPTYSLGCFTVFFYSGPQRICPQPAPDIATNYYFNRVDINSSTGQFVFRKNNIWEIRLDNVRKYHTKFQYNTQNPPCTAVWIKDSDGSEVTLTIGGNCQSESSCPTMTVTSSDASPLPSGTAITLTATGCSSPNVVTWNTGATGSTLSLTPTSATTYIATCFGATCSSSIASLAVTMQCATVLNLVSINVSAPSDDISSGTVIKQASSGVGGTITATNKVTGTGTNVTYQAKKIELNAGFKADNGTVFKAEIGGCQ